MSDIIQLLPEAIANQIAAGEVIQRPASVVKELMENSIDAGSTAVTLILKNSGKTLIQIIDNGKGMSETDARMSFERHATSKIKEAKDLFSIKTMGFRGEALASIASIAEVEMKTRPEDEDMATHITIKSSDLIDQTYCQAEPGTSIAVKNLFFNVPARKKFLKTDSVELKYILEEFKRIALAHCDLKFKVIHNDNEVYNLSAGSLKKRVINLFRKTYEDKIVRVDEETDIINISGLVGSPEIARKQKGEQYIFVNKRFIKSHYLNHAIKMAYESLLSDDQHPFYILFLEIDPERIDINVHPTKQEIKFDDERVIYNYLKVSVKHALGRYSLSPKLDFENEDSNLLDRSNLAAQGRKPSAHFSNTRASTTRTAPVMRNWQSLYSGLEEFSLEDDDSGAEQLDLTIPSAATGDLLGAFNPLENEVKAPLQLHNTFVVIQIKSGFLLIHQHYAHQRILYERYLHKLNKREELVQKQLFPISLQIGKDKKDVFADLIPSLNKLGFEIQAFGGDTFVVHGIPAGFQDNNLQEVIDGLIEQFIENKNLSISKNENLARSMAQSAAMKSGKSLTEEEMTQLIDELFACEMPYTNPSGKKCFLTFELKDLEKEFN
ncbi:MAG: DNA mismatch repair endonuclease MutL [Saprospiraceae bacterium]|nr:DNA mismatch repair endonuclease MutL [Saprospiraceae bacterium]